MKKKVLNILIVVFTIGVIYEVHNYIKEVNTTNNEVLENIQISDNLKETKQIAIKQQKTDFTWEDKGANMTAWPDIDTFEYYGSECTDASGKAITPTTDVIKFDEQKQTATISTSKTIYCTLSFARRSTVLKLIQQTTSEKYLKTVAKDDELLRYVGTYEDVNAGRLNNFVCFGTENIDECKNNKDTYMYRIIGMTTDNVNTNLGLTKDQLKIIKAVPQSEGTGLVWHNGSSCTLWDSVSLNTGYLNNANKFLGTIKGTIGTRGWSDLISSPLWYIADNNSYWLSYNSTTEMDKTTLSHNYKIGLMYASDYYDSFNYASDRDKKNSWLEISHGTSESANTYGHSYEWTMTRESNGSHCSAWGIDNSKGYLTTGSWDHEWSVRPVFYLTNEISISGDGTESNPFIISDRIIEE